MSETIKAGDESRVRRLLAGAGHTGEADEVIAELRRSGVAPTLRIGADLAHEVSLAWAGRDEAAARRVLSRYVGADRIDDAIRSLKEGRLSSDFRHILPEAQILDAIDAWRGDGAAMPRRDIKAGDVVRLRTGRRRLTAGYVSDISPMADCYEETEDGIRSVSLPVAALVRADESTESTGGGSRDPSPASPPRDGAGDRGGGLPGDGPPPSEHDERAVREAEGRLGVCDGPGPRHPGTDWHAHGLWDGTWRAITYSLGKHGVHLEAFAPTRSDAVLALDAKARAEGLYGEEPRPEPDESILAHEPRDPEARVRELMRSWHLAEGYIGLIVDHLREGYRIESFTALGDAGREKILAAWKGEAPR